MCGIVGYIGRQDAAPILMEGLHRLEYRGYDSAGLAVASNGALRLHKSKGKVRELELRLPKKLKGSPGIGHTRWATHGEPSDRNAHPHTDTHNRYAIVHNGIIENASVLRAQLRSKGIEFRSETDSEVLAHLIAAVPGDSLEEALRAALRLVTGAYGIAVLDAERPDALVVARNGSPVILGIGDREMFVASDVTALVRHTQRVVHLDDGEIAVVRPDRYETSTLEGNTTVKVPLALELKNESLDKGASAHYMHKEITEQPDAIRRTLSGRLERRFHTTHLGGLETAARELLAIRRVKILGCGSAYIAGCVGAQLIEQLTRIPAHAEPASEFRYRNPVIESDTLYIAVSQSGETFDTLAAIEEVKRKGGHVLGVVNAVGSTIARACGRGIYLHAGPEIAVVSTKTFVCTAVAMALFAIHIGRLRDLSSAKGERLITALEALPDQVAGIVANEAAIDSVARSMAEYRNVYFVGRAAGHAVAMEGALKLKEVSYQHAEAYAASELKHGPLALIDAQTPTVVVLPRDELYAKNISTIEEIRARRGPIYAVTHPGTLPVDVEGVLEVPRSEPELDPILLTVPLQLLAYRIALARGTEIDQPRNLAKSVTVE
ncbi:MAG TPA: glutamine--fructose-6-phosphate transaminase (isomerizing) [Steroidobacteraceae bacterium]|nr:glutamine--fructose-6-phosphate transaminase (isomerizing) [Steroidobacteraceae bacterium]